MFNKTGAGLKIFGPNRIGLTPRTNALCPGGAITSPNWPGIGMGSIENRSVKASYNPNTPHHLTVTNILVRHHKDTRAGPTVVTAHMQIEMGQARPAFGEIYLFDLITRHKHRKKDRCIVVYCIINRICWYRMLPPCVLTGHLTTGGGFRGWVVLWLWSVRDVFRGLQPSPAVSRVRLGTRVGCRVCGGVLVGFSVCFRAGVM